MPAKEERSHYPAIQVADSENKMTAKLVPATLLSLDRCGERLRSGKLVSFPTETVYGLGCHALDQKAVQKVFDAKQRPLSDPLIVHVVRNEDALELWAASSSMGRDGSTSDETDETHTQQQIEKKALFAITRSFFPGPLTVVARAHPSIPQILMANTGYVACRSPSHPVARSLIAAARVPIAAPSANKFGHVSPTVATHVMDDLGQEDVWVVDPSLGVENCDPSSTIQDGKTVCQVGVESTVVKIEMPNNVDRPSSSSKILGNITILRHGAISSQSISIALENANLSQYFTLSDSIKFTSKKVHTVAPGQTVKHYSPNLACFMISASRQIQSRREEHIEKEEIAVLSQSVIIDYGERLVHYQSNALAYRDLSPEGNPSIAASNIFETLRWSETVDGAIRVFVPELDLGGGELEGEDQALLLAVKDKLTRAASAVVRDTFQ